MKKARTSTLQEFLKRNPSLRKLDPMNKIDFDVSSLNKEEVVALKSFLAELCTDLTIYVELFDNKENLAELNKFNVLIFSRIERAYIERICLKFSTLMDPPKSCGKENLSFKRFIEITESNLLQALYDEIHDFYVVSGIKNWRNKVLAHADLSTFIANTIELNFRRSDITDVIAGCQEFVDWISDPTSTTDHLVKLPYGNDVSSFINGIKKLNNTG
ncbi:hypothetical protein GCM10009123_07710 [Kangiella japonica]|uniref:HEPN AbiU2-like domain-containing protein n=1 Tax=Kangiella japonica TaxID=647384 RepID=A0ABN0SW18_9GAMM